MGSGGGWWDDETAPGARGIDQFLADENRLDQGMGRCMIRDFIEHLCDNRAVTVMQTDPAPHNLRPMRCYQADGAHEHGGRGLRAASQTDAMINVSRFRSAHVQNSIKGSP